MDEIKLYHCLKCSETNQYKFSPKSLNLCRDCKLKEKDKKYACKSCGIENRDAFIEGRYSTCKFCRNKKKTESIKEKNYFEDSSRPNYEVEKIIQEYLKFNSSHYKGMSVYQINKFLAEENDKLRKDINELIEKNFILNENFSQLQMIVNKILIKDF